MNKTIKCLVSCTNSDGAPDFYQVLVEATEEQIENGEHFDAAKDSAEEHGYDSHLVYDDESHSYFTDKFDWSEDVETVYT